jgi:hypothetical protein
MQKPWDCLQDKVPVRSRTLSCPRGPSHIRSLEEFVKHAISIMAVIHAFVSILPSQFEKTLCPSPCAIVSPCRWPVLRMCVRVPTIATLFVSDLSSFYPPSAGSGLVCLIHGQAPDVPTIIVHFHPIIPLVRSLSRRATTQPILLVSEFEISIA